MINRLIITDEPAWPGGKGCIHLIASNVDKWNEKVGCMERLLDARAEIDLRTAEPPVSTSTTAAIMASSTGLPTVRASSKPSQLETLPARIPARILACTMKYNKHEKPKIACTMKYNKHHHQYHRHHFHHLHDRYCGSKHVIFLSLQFSVQNTER